MDKHVQISRDPFARHDVVRRVVDKHDRRDCDWCGREGAKYQYGIWPDDGGPMYENKVFCCKGCHDSYGD